MFRRIDKNETIEILNAVDRFVIEAEHVKLDSFELEEQMWNIFATIGRVILTASTLWVFITFLQLYLMTSNNSALAMIEIGTIELSAFQTILNKSALYAAVIILITFFVSGGQIFGFVNVLARKRNALLSTLLAGKKISLIRPQAPILEPQCTIAANTDSQSQKAV